VNELIDWLESEYKITISERVELYGEGWEKIEEEIIQKLKIKK